MPKSKQARTTARLEQIHREWVDSFDAIRDPIFLHDREFKVIRANLAYAELAGMPIKDILGKPYWQVFPVSDGPLQSCIEALGNPNAKEIRDDIRLDSGEVYTTRVFAVHNEDGSYRYSVHIMEDITERVRMNESLQKANRAQRIISSCNQAQVAAGSEEELLDTICQLIIKMGDYPMAWVGMKQEDSIHSILPVAYAGIELDTLNHLGCSWGDDAHGQTPAGEAIRTGKWQLLADIDQAAVYPPYRIIAEQYNCHSILTLPLKDQGSVIGVLNICGGERNTFDETELALLEELASDLAFGITALRNRIAKEEAERKQIIALNQLKNSMSHTIEAIAAATEVRDPYTAGHQKRVAQLASAIAREMGLTADEVECIQVAASIHDIGKLHVPSELLSNPRRLELIEYELIKRHAEVGYEILQHIDFPWPVATIVRQHHERLDGSGYPHGLKAGEILLEAQIIAVADVVESMGSHRPYRPALNLADAIREVAVYSGVYYEADVVKACLRLLTEKGFRLKPLPIAHNVWRSRQPEDDHGFN